MAFGVKRAELMRWKQAIENGQIAFLTHYWYDARFPNYTTVTKVGCADLHKLEAWCLKHRLNPSYIHHHKTYPHFDLMGPRQLDILKKEGQWEQVERFKLDT